MNQQRKGLSRHNSRQSSIGETTSVGSSKSNKSNCSGDYYSTNTANTNTNHSSQTNTTHQQSANNKKSLSNGFTKRQGSQDSGDSGTGSQPTSILNVAEMLLHGVADDEILNIWLRSIQCEEFVAKFIEAGYDMPTISRITPQDLTAIGVTEPAKRLKILTEIKKLNLQDGIPNFKPNDLSHWLTLIRLDNHYYKSLCDQQVDTIEKLCQLTWEDFEELGITKLGHQKRFQLAIERIKELEINSKCSKSKTISEPIYDTNPSQILLVASSENHSMNGPIINKQSSTSELSSTGSGSMHSVYSAASAHYQPTYAPISDIHQQAMLSNQLPNNNSNQQNQQQAIYGQASTQNIIYQQPSHLMATRQQQQQSHYQQHYPIQPATNQFADMSTQSQLATPINVMNQHQQPPQNRQSMSQLPFSALANLPKHQQQLLQQSSIYATLSRQPSKAKQPPPPVPIRTNSLKCNSLIEEQVSNQQQSEQGISTNSLFKTNGPRNNQHRNQFNSQTMLTKNKSFSGNAHMEASRARFLNRASQQPQQFNHNLSQQIQSMLDDRSSIIAGSATENNHQFNNNQNLIYGVHQATNGLGPAFNSSQNAEERSLLGQSISSSNNYVQQAPTNNQLQSSIMHRPQVNMSDDARQPQGTTSSMYHRNDYDTNSDTTSTKSLIMPPSAASIITSPVENSSLSQDSGSSQTLYNSASSGSNSNTDQQSLNNIIFNGNLSQPGDLMRASAAQTTASSCTLNDANLILDRHQVCTATTSAASMPNSSLNFNGSNNSSPIRNGIIPNAPNRADAQQHCNATTGKDDHFPPPPSPLSLTDSDEHDLVSINSDNNFTDVNRGMMTFRVGI